MVSHSRKKQLHRARRWRASKRIATLPWHISKNHYFPKMRGGHTMPARPALSYILATWICSIVAISVLYAVSDYTHSILVMAPFGATCVLIFGAPDSPVAQPRNVIGGYFIATILSIIIWKIAGDGWWVVALSVGTIIAIMQFTRTLHPPAGAIVLVVMSGHASWSFVFVPVLAGAALLVLCGVITNNFAKDRHYPKYWW